MISVVNEIKDLGLAVGLVAAAGVTIRESSPGFAARLRDLVAASSTEDVTLPKGKEAVRALLRRGGFKPSGRNKPASEYLGQAAREGRFPYINNVVDINNFVSLGSGLPVSMLDLELFRGEIRLRLGRPGESYIFNQSGQQIDLAGLICVWGGEPAQPLGNPIKDSMAAKVKAETCGVLGVIYAPAEHVPAAQLREYAEQMGVLLQEEGGAQELEVVLG